MFILSFETIARYVSLSISKDGALLDSLICLKNFAHAEKILTSIELILSRNKISYIDIDLFCVIIGPSSFIKIRVGIAVAYGLEFSTGKKVISVNLFEIYENIINRNYNLYNSVIILNAYSDNFYVRYINNDLAVCDFVNIDQIESLLARNENILCDSEVINKIKHIESNSKIFDISKEIDNLSAEAGLLVKKKIDEGLIDLENVESVKPFYLFNPVFRKKNKIIINNDN